MGDRSRPTTKRRPMQGVGLRLVRKPPCWGPFRLLFWRLQKFCQRTSSSLRPHLTQAPVAAHVDQATPASASSLASATTSPHASILQAMPVLHPSSHNLCNPTQAALDDGRFCVLLDALPWPDAHFWLVGVKPRSSSTHSECCIQQGAGAPAASYWPQPSEELFGRVNDILAPLLVDCKYDTLCCCRNGQLQVRCESSAKPSCFLRILSFADVPSALWLEDPDGMSLPSCPDHASRRGHVHVFRGRPFTFSSHLWHEVLPAAGLHWIVWAFSSQHVSRSFGFSEPPRKPCDNSCGDALVAATFDVPAAVSPPPVADSLPSHIFLDLFSGPTPLLPVQQSPWVSLRCLWISYSAKSITCLIAPASSACSAWHFLAACTMPMLPRRVLSTAALNFAPDPGLRPAVRLNTSLDSRAMTQGPLRVLSTVLFF